MNEMIILAGSNYNDTAIGGLGIVAIAFGIAWLIGLFDTSKKKDD